MLISGADASREYRRLRRCIGPHDEARHAGLSFTHPTGAEFGSNAFSPLSRSPVLWYRADKGTTVVTGVSSWVSQGSNTLAVTQSTGADQPTLTASTLAWNDQATLDFSSDAMSLTAASFTLAQPCTLYVFCSITTTSGTQSFIYSAGGAQFGKSGTDFYFYDGATHTDTSGDTNPHAFCVVLDGSSGGLYVDNSSTAVVAGSGSDGFSSGLQISSAFANLTGVLAEIVVLSGADSQVQRHQFFSYGASRYGLSSS